MKLKSTLRSFLAMAGSSLLTITYVSAAPETYYWDSNNNTAGFGTTAGAWTSSVSSAGGNGFTTSAAGTADITGAGAVTTDVEDDIFFGRGVNLRNVATISGDATVTCESTTGLEAGMTVVGTGITVGTTVLSITSPTEFELSANATLTQIVIQWGANFPYTGTTTITGPVSAKSIYTSISAGNLAGASQTINFAAEGSYETAKANTAFAATTTLGGAGTSMTWKIPYSSSCNITAITTNNAAQNIIQGPGRLGVTTIANLGPDGRPLVFKGGVLRFVNTFPCDTYPSVTAFNAKHPISFTLNEDAGFDNQNNTSAKQTFTVDVPLTLGTGAFSVEGNGGANFILTNTGNNYTGATLLIGANLQISDAAHIGASTAPFYFNGTLKITGDTMTTLGSRPVVIKGGSTMKLNIDSSSNTFTVGQTLTDNVAGDGYALGAWQDVAGTCGVTKTGAGTLLLSAASNTYTGATTVTAGTLSVTGSLGATAVSIATSTLSGNGNFGGNVTIAATGTHRLAVAATTGAQDTSVITGTLALTAGNILDLTAAATPADGVYELATATAITGTPTTVNYNGITGVASVNTSGSPHKLLLTVNAALPTLISIADDVSGGPVAVNTLVTYTVTFSEEIDDTTVSAADFSNSGSSTITIGAITETSPNVFTVEVTPTSAGTLILQIPTSAEIKDSLGGVLNDNPALVDDTTITVTVASGYASWKGANAGGQDPDEDFDNDGVDNGVEYFMDADPGFTASPALDGTNTITWTNGGNILPAAYGTEYVIQTSSDLSTWADVLVGDLTANTAGPAGSLTYTLTGAAPRFVRLKVTPN